LPHSDFDPGVGRLSFSFAFMLRLSFILAFLIVGAAGCSRKADAVIGAFGNDEFTTNRIVFYATGRCEHYGSLEDGTLARQPARAGTFIAGTSNYVVTFGQANLFQPNNPPVRKVYRIINHDGVEYLFEEGSLAIKNYEVSKEPQELRHAWRREGG
jgi:hypothetical protein